MLDGLVAAYPGLTRLPGQTVRADHPEPAARPVGGSGHEPAHSGYVGLGMLTAAVAGDVFKSPDPDSVLAAIRATAGPLYAAFLLRASVTCAKAARTIRGLGG